ncbi:unnamed protein product [Durusdinium trenchii]|uniref:Cysteine protease n=1 Tax=Durusdinium trenchii TaxID=1381693 RepID=A0ABP0KXS4_9DINO
MSSSLPLVVSFLACCVAVTAAITPVERAFEQYLKDADFGKSYKDPVEKQARFEAFLDNYEYILRENSKGHSYTLGFTYFTDMSVEDFETSHFGMKPRKPSAASRSKHVVRNVSLPSSVDWRTEGAVTAVKNQERQSRPTRGSTGALEGAWAIATGKLESLSEQQLVDCSSSFGNEGCNGGDMDDAFQYEEENAVCTEQSYPYTATGGICNSSSCTVGIPRGSVTGYVDVEADDEEALMDAVAQQPVSVAIEADKRAFQNYKSGVLSKVCGTSLDHGVLVVGYGTEWGRPYWLVKNSWGSFWGEDGYVKLERGKPGGRGVWCEVRSLLPSGGWWPCAISTTIPCALREASVPGR